MIAALMGYGLAVSTLLAAAALAAERYLHLVRRPTRFLWLAAMLSSLVICVARFAASVASDTASSLARDASAPMRMLVRDGSPVTALDRPLLIAWIAASIAGLFVVAIATLRLMKPISAWLAASVDDVPVLVSPDYGPAVIGCFRHHIVVPAWALELEPAQRDLVLTHEREHAAANDPRLLLAATIVVAIAPWNVALWWMAHRLRIAVELDCDSRVLRARPDAAAYGALLLEVSERVLGGNSVVAAFAEPVSLIERRIAAMTNQTPRFASARRIAAGGVAAFLVLAACLAPGPVRVAAPIRFISISKPHPVSPSVAADLALDVRVAEPVPSVRRLSHHVVVASQPRSTGGASVAGERIGITPAVTAYAVQAVSPVARAPADSMFDWLFEGIVLTPEQEARARYLLTMLETRQRLQDEVTRAQATLAQAKAAALDAERNASLRELLASDADRTTFDANVAKSARTGKVFWLVSARADSLNPKRVRLVGRGQVIWFDRVDSMFTPYSKTLPAFRRFSADGAMHALFEGISLSADQAARARALIDKTDQAVDSERPSRPTPILRFEATTGTVSIRVPADAELLALLTNDADRAKLQSRITRIPQ
jgi:beta-lactamase regulating signal transducer with metallopeptidase domain